MKFEVRIKRVHDEPTEADGYRVLIDRLWPRGVTKGAARLDDWAKDLAPSTELRTWFGHDPAKFDEFAEQYRSELAADHDAIKALRSNVTGGVLTLIYAAADPVHNHAVVLRDVLQSQQ